MIIRHAETGDCDGIAEVHVAAWRESYRRLVPDFVLDGLSIPQRAASWRIILAADLTTFVAEEAGAIVGFANGGTCRSVELAQDMEVYAIYLLSRVKRHGFGGRLLRCLMADLVARGGASAGVWVLRENMPARAFYERLGAKLVIEKTDHRPDYELTEVGYVWPDLKKAFAL
jgi:L-amino acid N-acyltransferase YncA